MSIFIFCVEFHTIHILTFSMAVILNFLFLIESMAPIIGAFGARKLGARILKPYFGTARKPPQGESTSHTTSLEKEPHTCTVRYTRQTRA